MKKLLYILMFICPIAVSAQQPWLKSSPMDYMWMNVGNALFSEGSISNLSFAFDSSGQPCVAYGDWAYAQRLNVMKFDGIKWEYVGSPGISGGQVFNLDLAFSPDGQPFVVYTYNDNVHEEIMMVKKFDGSGWINVGSTGFLYEVQDLSLDFNPINGQPYVAFNDPTGTSVITYDGNSWVFEGLRGFSGAGSYNTSLDFTNDGVAYVTFSDYSKGGKATVMKFDGNDWIAVGSRGLSDGETDYNTIVLSPTGIPYVSYEDFAHYQAASVMRFNGNVWESVGSPGFTVTVADYPDISCNSDGSPYLVYSDAGSYNKAHVKQFDGFGWNDVGGDGFSEGWASFTHILLSPSNIPYVAFIDGNILGLGGATVMKYDSVFVGINEVPESGFSLYPNPATNMVTFETNPPSLLTIMNLNGQQLLTRQITEPKTQLDISTLPAGVYVVRLTNDRTTQVGKIIKQ